MKLRRNKLLSSFLVFLILCSNNVYSETIVLNKGDVAPYSGLLIDQRTAEEVRKTKLENDSNKKIIEIMNEKLELKDLSLKYREDQVNILNEQNNKLSSRLEKTTNTATWEKILWFGLGVIGTGLAVRTAVQLNR